jgi:hypothetical protein
MIDQARRIKMDLTLHKKLLVTLGLIYVLVDVGRAFAVPSYSFLNAPLDIVSGEIFTVDVVLDLDGYSSIGHEVSVSFSPGPLIAVEAVELGVPPFQLNLSPGVRSIDNTDGIVDQFEAASFSSIAPTTTFVVGQITFEAGYIGEAIIIGFFDSGAAVLDGAGQAIDGVVFDSVMVNVIPAPTATPTTSPVCQEPSTPCKRNRDCCSGLCVGKGLNKTCQSGSTSTPTALPTPTPTVLTTPTPTPTATPTATPNEMPSCQEPPASCRRHRDCCSGICAGKGSNKSCQPGGE